ncbi:hypothetical protein NM688_g1993 [Phlebia brevispora]|uniref:Uncharacterized protein n=1 Tax=Phlebia brevispora TaxID=194682 RepID=A0ACC1T9J0_9APHY|nr:hypothetical protein NM688_g1993 [Phlebia brevispora]
MDHSTLSGLENTDVNSLTSSWLLVVTSFLRIKRHDAEITEVKVTDDEGIEEVQRRGDAHGVERRRRPFPVSGWDPFLVPRAMMASSAESQAIGEARHNSANRHLQHYVTGIGGYLVEKSPRRRKQIVLAANTVIRCSKVLMYAIPASEMLEQAPRCVRIVPYKHLRENDIRDTSTVDADTLTARKVVDIRIRRSTSKLADQKLNGIFDDMWKALYITPIKRNLLMDAVLNPARSLPARLPSCCACSHSTTRLRSFTQDAARAIAFFADISKGASNGGALDHRSWFECWQHSSLPETRGRRVKMSCLDKQLIFAATLTPCGSQFSPPGRSLPLHFSSSTVVLGFLPTLASFIQAVHLIVFLSNLCAMKPNHTPFSLEQGSNSDGEKKAKGLGFWLIVVSLCMSLFLSALEMTSVSNALPIIVQDLHGEDFVWVGSAYALASTALLPASGGLAEAFGRRATMLMALGLFALGSALCGAAQSMNMLIGARAVQGMGGGGILSLTSIILSDLVPLKDRGLYNGLIGLTWGFASAIGPLIGGALAQNGKWRWLFYLNLPICGVAAAFVLAFLKLRTPAGTLREKILRIDWIGIMIITASTVSCVIALTWAGIRYPWSSPKVLAPLILGVVGLGVFLLYEAYLAQNPIVPAKLLANRTSVSGYLQTFLTPIVSLTAIYYSAIYGQACKGHSPIHTAVDFLGISVALGPAVVASGVSIGITKVYRPQIWIGWIILAVASGVMSTLNVDSRIAEIAGLPILLGVGLGMLMSATYFPVLAPLPVSENAHALAFFAFCRSFAGVWGITIGGTILQNQLSQKLPAQFLAQFPGGAEIAFSVIPTIAMLPEPLKREVQDIFASGISRIWYVMAGVSAAGFVVSLFMKGLPLHTEVDDKWGMSEEKPEKALETVTLNDTLMSRPLSLQVTSPTTDIVVITGFILPSDSPCDIESSRDLVVEDPVPPPPSVFCAEIWSTVACGLFQVIEDVPCGGRLVQVEYAFAFNFTNICASKSPHDSQASKKHGVSAQYVHTNVNPVVDGSNYALAATDLVQINEEGIKAAAKYISSKFKSDSYTPRTWRTHPLHLCPPEPYSPSDPRTAACLDWIFLISSLNFSFWSEREGHADRFGIEWREGWDTEARTVHTGYWSLVAAIDKALEAGLPFTDPAFYASEIDCPDSLIEKIFQPAVGCSEGIPLLQERIAILRENGAILNNYFGGSFSGFHHAFQKRYQGRGTALRFVKMVTEQFPSFRDECIYEGQRICLWKRAQILVAEAWAAFYPASPSTPHPLFPNGAAICELTMFADYRVPQILHHLRILSYPPELLKLLRSHTLLPSGSREEVSIRAASIIAVEKVREEIVQTQGVESELEVSSVLIDFYLWDLAKKIESGEEKVDGMETTCVEPAHCTRSIWY